MPGGHASHKGHSAKPNTNANGVIDTSLGVESDPDPIVEETFRPARDGEEIVDNSLATQRPGEELMAGDSKAQES